MSVLRTLVLLALDADPDSKIDDLTIAAKVMQQRQVTSKVVDVLNKSAKRDIRIGRELRELAEISPELARRLNKVADQIAPLDQVAEYERINGAVGEAPDPLTELMDALFGPAPKEA